ncbi:cobalamin B12-binding domain-containing protein [Branchiibius hedensis]|uniref:cobalamin B12-binding domain-containing protein n=1 Tax=Branchiibius hedensis TaxID=672460 RepID=UPI001476575C|nr:B12-binding domain-containing protein [Branchiibius hedensis]
MHDSSDNAAAVLQGREEIFDAILGLDADTMRQLILGFQASGGTDLVVADVLIPVLRRVGDMWASGQLSVLHEHHASRIVRSVMAEFRRPATQIEVQVPVVMACPPGELHDLPSHLFSLMLLERGLTPVVLGADTPWKATAAAVRSCSARACVLSGMKPAGLRHRSAVVKLLAQSAPVLVAGPLGERTSIPGVIALPANWRLAGDQVLAAATRATSPATVGAS